MKILIESFRQFLKEDIDVDVGSDPVWVKLKRLARGGRAVQAFELAASFGDKLLRDLLLEYAKIWKTYLADEPWAEGYKEPEWLGEFISGHKGMTISELDEILEKIKEILSIHGEHYDDDELANIYDLQNNIQERKRAKTLFPQLF